MLSNYYYDWKIFQKYIPGQFVFYEAYSPKNLLSVSAEILSLENSYENQREMIYLIRSMIDNIPMQFLEPFILSSQILHSLIKKIEQNHLCS